MKKLKKYLKESDFLLKRDVTKYPYVSYTKDTDKSWVMNKPNYILATYRWDVGNEYNNVNYAEHYVNDFYLNGRPDFIDREQLVSINEDGSATYALILKDYTKTEPISFIYIDEWGYEREINVFSYHDTYNYVCVPLISLDFSNAHIIIDYIPWDSIFSPEVENIIFGDNFDTSNMTYMDGMFRQCYKLKSITFGDKFITSNVTNMSNMFVECYDLTSLDLSSFDTSNVTNMSNMFNGCESLTSLDLSSFDTSNVTSMYKMFSTNDNLKSMTMMGDVSNVSSQFSLTPNTIFNYNCNYDYSNLLYNLIALPNPLGCEKTYLIKVLDYNNNTYPTDLNLTLSNGVKGVYNEELNGYTFTFENVKDIVEYDILQDDVKIDTLYTYIDNQFIIINCNNILIKELITTSNNSEYNILYNKYNNIIKLYIDGNETEPSSNPIIENSGIHIIHIELDISYINDISYMFYNCNAITEIKFNDNFDTYNITNMSNMFKNCNCLRQISFGNGFNTSNVTDMSDMFYNCYYLNSLNLNNFDTINVTDMSGMFSGCSGLTSLDVSSFNTSNVTDMYSMFNGCYHLISLDLSNFDTSNVIDMRCMFEYCVNLEYINLNSFNTTKVTSLYKMFSECRNLETIDLSSFDMTNVTDVSGMLYFDTYYNQNLPKINKLIILGNVSNIEHISYIFGASTSYSPYLNGELICSCEYKEYFKNNIPPNWKLTCYGETLTKLKLIENGIEVNNGKVFIDNNECYYNNEEEVWEVLINSNNNTENKIYLNDLEIGVIDYNNDVNIIFVGDNNDSYFDIIAKTYTTSYSSSIYNMIGNYEPIKYLFLDNKLVTYDINGYVVDSQMPHTVKIKLDLINNTDISNLFYNCDCYSSITFSNKIDTSNVTNMSGMFSSCNRLTSIEFGEKGDVSKVTSYNYMFNGLPSNGMLTYTIIYSDAWNKLLVTNSGTTYFPSTWMTTCKTIEITNKIKIIENSLEIKEGNVVVNNTTFSFNELEQVWEGSYITEQQSYSIYLNDVEIGETNNKKLQYIFIGNNNASYSGINITEIISATSTSSSYRLINNNYIQYINAILIDGEQIIPSSNYIFNTVGEHTVKMLIDTSKITNMDYMFSDCYGLTSLDLSNFDTSNVTSMDGMFTYCTGLTSLDLSNFDTSNVISMYRMFDKCNSLTSLDLSSFDTSNVTSMYQMFKSCNSLTSLDLSSFDTSNVTSMSEMFIWCTGLTSLNLSSFDTSNVTSMGQMFQNCYKLTSLDLSSFDTSNVTSMYQMFNSCSGLTSIEFGEKGDVSKVVSHNYMFNGLPLSCEIIICVFTYNTWDKVLNNNNLSKLNIIFSCQELIDYTNLVINAKDVDGRATSTIISYTATLTLKNNNTCIVTGTSVSEPFEQNTSTTNEIIRTVTFEYLGATASTTFTQGVWVAPSYSIKLNDQWQLSSTISNPDSSLYDGVYESFSNKGIGYSAAICTITINGYENFKLYVRSYGRSNYDYVVVSNLDYILTSGTTSGTNVKITTKGNQQSGTAITDYTLVEFDNIGGGEHTIQVMYRKGGYSSSGDDRGYLLIPFTYIPTSCTNLVINAENVNGIATSTTISYTATTNGVDNEGNEVTNIVLTGTSVSEPFEQNTSYADEIVRTITFEYMGVTATTTFTQGAWIDPSYSIDLNNQWQLSTSTLKPNELLYNGVYKSFSNKSNGDISKLLIHIIGYDVFTLYVLASDYGDNKSVMVSNLDKEINSFDNKNNSELVKGYSDGSYSITRDPNDINNYKKIEFTNIHGGEHTIEVVYGYESIDDGINEGYLILPKNSSKLTFKFRIFKDCNEIINDNVKVNDIVCNYDNINKYWIANDVSYSNDYIVTLNEEEINRLSAENDDIKLILLGDNNDLYEVEGLVNVSSTTESVNIINNSYVKNISMMVIDDKIVLPTYSKRFDTIGNHTIKFIFDTSNITSIKNMFYSCDMLNITINSSFKLNNITDMSGLFNASNLNTINLNCNVSNVTDISGMFTNCFDLTTVTFGDNFDTSNVTDMNGMFYNCEDLTTVNVSALNTSNVTDMNNMFYNCYSLYSLNLSNWNTSNVTNMSNMFSYYSIPSGRDGLKYITFGDKFITSKVTNMSSMFHHCGGLTSLDLSNFDTSNVTDMSWMFRYCSGIKTLNLKSFNTSKVTNMWQMFTGCNNMTISFGYYSDVTNNPSDPFMYSEDSVTLSLCENTRESWEELLSKIGYTNINRTYRDCSNEII